MNQNREKTFRILRREYEYDRVKSPLVMQGIIVGRQPSLPQHPTPMQSAIHAQDLTQVKRLVNEGALAQSDDHGRAFLLYALRVGRSIEQDISVLNRPPADNKIASVIRVLINAGASADDQDRDEPFSELLCRALASTNADMAREIAKGCSWQAFFNVMKNLDIYFCHYHTFRTMSFYELVDRQKVEEDAMHKVYLTLKTLANAYTQSMALLDSVKTDPYVFTLFRIAGLNLFKACKDPCKSLGLPRDLVLEMCVDMIKHSVSLSLNFKMAVTQKLILATKANDAQTVSELIASGVDLAVCDHRGRSALAWASLMNNTALRQMLTDAAAQPAFALDNDGDAIMQIAAP